MSCNGGKRYAWTDRQSEPQVALPEAILRPLTNRKP
jgi:hypothetical protein